MACDAVKQRGKHLCLFQPQLVHRLVDHQLVHHQLIFGHADDAICQLFNGCVKFGQRRNIGRQAPGKRCFAVDGVAGQQHLLGAHGTEAVDPHGWRGAAPHAGGHVADAGGVLHHDEVAAGCDVAATRHRIAMHAGDGGLVRAPQAHEVFGVFLHQLVVQHRVPGHRLGVAVGEVALRVLLQVIACAKRLARALNHDGVHPVIVIGQLHRCANLTGHCHVDGVEPFWAVQGDGRHTVQHLHLDG